MGAEALVAWSNGALAGYAVEHHPAPSFGPLQWRAIYILTERRSGETLNLTYCGSRCKPMTHMNYMGGYSMQVLNCCSSPLSLKLPLLQVDLGSWWVLCQE